MLGNLNFEGALARVRPHAWRTPVVPLDLPGAPPVFMKLESLQHTGSFKVRGAANRLHKLSAREREAGVIAASSGNHGRAVATVAARLGIPATICVPDWVDPSKLRAIRATGARVVMAGPSYDEAEERAATLAETAGRSLVHAFDDPDVIEGQGTLGVEIACRLPEVEEVIVPLSAPHRVAGRRDDRFGALRWDRARQPTHLRALRERHQRARDRGRERHQGRRSAGVP